MPRPAEIVVLALLMAHAVGAGPSPPLVVAVDTSRSLTLSELSAAAVLLTGALNSFPAETSSGVIEFDDTARWRVPIGATPARSAEGLRGIAPGGHFTVLRDALFVAAKELIGGGVIVLVTDGRDENSAATVEDVVRLCGQRHVHIVALGLGRSLDERALRRLSLLTGGSYLGREDRTDPVLVSRAVEESRRAAIAELQREAGPAPTPAPAPPVAPAVSPPTRAAVQAPRAYSPLLSAVFGALLVLAAGAGVWLWRKRSRTRTCPRCGSLLASWETECSNCLIRETHDEQKVQAAPAPVAEEEMLDPTVFNKAPLDEQLDKTFALQDQQILTVREQKKPPRSYFLHASEAFSVGRAPRVNTLVLDDPTLSAQHLKIVPRAGEFFVVDLQTTNGTLVNGERVRARRLHPGDVIRAGEVEFDFRVQYRRVT